MFTEKSSPRPLSQKDSNMRQSPGASSPPDFLCVNACMRNTFRGLHTTTQTHILLSETDDTSSNKEAVTDGKCIKVCPHVSVAFVCSDGKVDRRSNPSLPPDPLFIHPLPRRGVGGVCPPFLYEGPPPEGVEVTEPGYAEGTGHAHCNFDEPWEQGTASPATMQRPTSSLPSNKPKYLHHPFSLSPGCLMKIKTKDNVDGSGGASGHLSHNAQVQKANHGQQLFLVVCSFDLFSVKQRPTPSLPSNKPKYPHHPFLSLSRFPNENKNKGQCRRIRVKRVKEKRVQSKKKKKKIVGNGSFWDTIITSLGVQTRRMRPAFRFTINKAFRGKRA
ncbi:hypothetical protein CEXT_615861 [Caerostris extrusa]|uniref:Uncharacterized protein n=1 Tax=Caerostris extrusa TaxID=172846 RepID=A0AAV4SIQ4_CAEEX|nr:hypothetical protein CEXT_615861 [Caerostris extrusa]